MTTYSSVETLLQPTLTIPALLLAGVVYALISLLFPISRSAPGKIPGPLFCRFSGLFMVYTDWRGERVRTIKKFHNKYGSAVRISSNEVSFSSLSAMRKIYGAGSPFERTSFYRPFDVYGHQNLFTFGPTVNHRERKKLLSHIYANRTILSAEVSPMIEEKAAHFLNLLEQAQSNPIEIFSTLHYFSMDAISTFVYGHKHGGTTALLGTHAHVALLSDILSPTRRKLAWFSVHLPKYTRWAYSQSWPLSSLISTLGLLPMKPPTTYSGIRAHALTASTSYLLHHPTHDTTSPPTVLARLHAHQLSQPGSLSDLDIASECADHLLAGIDTTADTLLFLIWVLSLEKHRHIQEILRSELRTHFISNPAAVNPNTGVPAARSLVTLPYLNAVIRETLRLYTPLPATEPRLCRTDIVIDGYAIPAGTVVGMAPYVLHRDEFAYPSPLLFNPERWLQGNGKEHGAVDRANRQFWAFSSGPRMCIGMHLAMAEMLTLVAAIYGRYRSTVREGEERLSPAVTSRFEMFFDERADKILEHECWVRFERSE